jgi:molybdate transport system regulatory protein
MHSLAARSTQSAARTPTDREYEMKTSARNTYPGTIEQVIDGAINSEVTLKVSERLTIHAVVTRHSVAELGLAAGKPAMALIKSSFVILARAGEIGRTSARNAVKGTLAKLDEGAVSTEITLDLGDGLTLVAVITRDSAQSLGFKLGERLVALIKAPHVILAVD